MTRRTDRGIALVLVLTIVLALVLIATPFVLSMVKQEQAATVQKAGAQARHGADAVRAFGAATVMRTSNHYERRLPAGIFSTPYSDRALEFILDVRDGKMSALQVTDPTGKIWGVVAEDEQAKLNIRTTPDRAMRTLRTHIDERVIDIKDYTTQYSMRDSRWIFPQRVRAIGSITLPSGKTVNGVLIDNALHYGIDPTANDKNIRFVAPGRGAPHLTSVRANYLISDGAHVIEPYEMPPGGTQVVEIEQRHPVNLNAARRETLASMFEGVAIDLGRGIADQISRDEAMGFALAMRGQVFENWGELALFLVRLNVGSLLDRATVLLALADPTNVALNGTGTVPGCFTSYDTVTLLARGMMNTPAGTPMSSVGFREVADLGPPAPITWTLESQLDFDRYLADALFASNVFAAAGGPQLQQLFGGFPWGSRWVTFPNKFPTPGDKALKAQPPPPTLPPPGEAFLQLDHAPDFRGIAQYKTFRDPFPNEIEGLRLNGRPHQYPWTDAFTSNPDKPDPDPLRNAPDVAAGGFELWLRWDTVADGPIFDIREQDSMNRISLDLVRGELLLRVTDATMDDPAKRAQLAKGLCEIKLTFTPIADTWYHFGIYWKGTRWAHMALLIDGFADLNGKFKHTDMIGNPTITELASALAAPPAPPAPQVSGIGLADNKWMPDLPSAEVNDPEPNSWPLLIGDEVVHYDKAGGQVARGMRGTTARDHPKDAKVQLFGYSSKLRPMAVQVPFPQGAVTMLFDRLPSTAGLSIYSFGQNPTATVMGDKTDPNTGMTYIDATQNYVPVTSANINDYPQRGYIVIEQEVIYYDGIQGGASPRFINCARGQHGTTAATHNTGRPVFLWSIAVDTTKGYLSPTAVQIEEEWFGPVQVDTVRAGFLIGTVVSGGVPVLVYRGMPFGSRNTAHNANEKVIPIFSVSESDIAVNRSNCQRWDYVTVIDAALTRTFGRVRRASNPGNWQLAGQTGAWQGGATPNPVQLVALWDHVPLDYVPDQQSVRVIKWPSGELLDIRWLMNANPMVTIGPGVMTIDEAKFYASPKGAFAIAAQADDKTTTVTMNNAAGLGNTVGAVKIGDEIIGFPVVKANDLSQCSRGWLNSPPQVHAQGELAFNLSFLPITKLAAGIGPDDRYVPVPTMLQGQGYTAGYMLVGQEVIGFEQVIPQGRNAFQYDAFLDFKGTAMFRGRFGTRRAQHNGDDLAYGIPFRYWDTYRAEAFDSRQAYYQASTTFRGANWRTVGWTEHMPAADRGLRTRCTVRVDGMGEMWELPAVDDRHLLWDFATPNAANQVGRMSGMRDQGQLDIRFQVEYLSGCYWPAHGWKRSPRIKQIQVEYDRPFKVVYHEDD